MKRLMPVLALHFLLSGIFLHAQPYALHWKREAWIGAATLTLLAADLGLSTGLSPLLPQRIPLLQRDDVWKPDRSATFLFSRPASLRSDIALVGTGALAGAIGLLAPADRKVLALMWLETNLLTLEGAKVFKHSIRRPRPFVYNPDVPLELKLEKDARKAFFSGHTALAAANSFFAAKVFADCFPDSSWKPLVWGLAVALPAWTGVERYLAGKHFPTDVAAGYAFGALAGWLIPTLHRMDGDLHIRPAASGAGISLSLQVK